jgi:hypothetical protein
MGISVYMQAISPPQFSKMDLDSKVKAGVNFLGFPK